jgi:hypothetical protein
MTVNFKTNNFGEIALADGRFVQLIQQAYNANASDGSAAWFAAGYLSTETPENETGPTVKVCWTSLGADESVDDAAWSNPDSITHYSLGALTPA